MAAMVEHTENFSDTRPNAVDLSWRYEGEMETIHGKRDTKRFIHMKKWETCKDKQGTTMYRKVVHSDAAARTMTHEAKISRARQVDDEQADELAAISNGCLSDNTGFDSLQRIDFDGRAAKKPAGQLRDGDDGIAETDVNEGDEDQEEEEEEEGEEE